MLGSVIEKMFGSAWACVSNFSTMHFIKHRQNISDENLASKLNVL